MIKIVTTLIIKVRDMGNCCCDCEYLDRICDKSQPDTGYTNFSKATLLGCVCQQCSKEIRSVSDCFIMNGEFLVGKSKNPDIKSIILCGSACHRQYLLKYHAHKCSEHVNRDIAISTTIDDL